MIVCKSENDGRGNAEFRPGHKSAKISAKESLLKPAVSSFQCRDALHDSVVLTTMENGNSAAIYRIFFAHVKIYVSKALNIFLV